MQGEPLPLPAAGCRLSLPKGSPRSRDQGFELTLPFGELGQLAFRFGEARFDGRTAIVKSLA